MSKRNRVRRKTSTPLMVIATGTVLVLVAVIWALSGRNPEPRAGVGEPVTSSSQGAIPLPEITRVSLEDARAAYDGGQAVFLDVRTQSQYDRSHIPGAILMDLDTLEERLGGLDRSQWFITYCT